MRVARGIILIGVCRTDCTIAAPPPVQGLVLWGIHTHTHGIWTTYRLYKGLYIGKGYLYKGCISLDIFIHEGRAVLRPI